MLFLCTVALGCAFIAPKNAVKAAVPTTSDTVIQLTLDSTNLAPSAVGGKMFSGEELAKLYDAILGTNYNNVGTYNKLKKALTNADGTTTQTWTSATSSATTVVPNAITSADIRSKNGKNIYVMIGKTAFEVVYVTLNNSNEVIVDLWQSTSTQVSPWAANASGSAGYSKSENRNNNANTRPSQVYGLSYMRAVVLGNGGEYDAFSGQESSSTHVTGVAAGNAVGSYATLWNSMTTGALSAFIDTPSQVKYQEVESYSAFERVATGASDGYWRYTNPGDAYGIPYDEYYHDGTFNYWSGAQGNNSGYGGNGTNQITNQDQWKDDKLWLPSMTETGFASVMASSASGVSGIWGLDSSQRKNDSGTGSFTLKYDSNSLSATWLRSGKAYNQGSIFALMNNSALSNGWTSAKIAVRPALHLNLSKAQAAADYIAVNTPTNLEFVYDGIEYTDMADIIKRVEAGKQKTPADANGDTNSNKEIKWFDGVLHAVGGNTAGNAADTIYKTDSAIEYKVEYKQAGKTNFASPMTDFKIKGAGEYKITCSFETGSGTTYKWRDINTGALDTATTKTFTITVKQLEVKYKWKSQGGKLNETDTDPAKQWKVTFDKATFTPASGSSAAPWVYLDYTLLTSADCTDNADAALLTYDQTTKKAQLGGVDNDTLPCIVVKYVNTEGYDNVLDNIYVNKNGTTAPLNGTNRAFPQEAGSYKVTAEDINAKTSNYKLVADTGEMALTSSRGYEIEKYEVQAPITPASPLVYSGVDQSYRVPNYNDKYMEYGTWDGTTFTTNATPTDMTAGTTGADSPLTLKATKANDYKISFQLLKSTVANSANPIVRNYKWKSTDTTINGTTGVWTINYAIQPKTLELDFHSTVTGSNGNETFTIMTTDTTGKLTYSFKASASPVNSESPVIELYYAKSGAAGSGSINPNSTGDPTEFLYADLADSNGDHKAGKYVIYAQLASSSANPVNENYRLKDPDAIAAEMTAAGASTSDINAAVKAAKATYQKEVTLTAGAVNLNDIPIVYKEGDNITDSNAPADLDFDYDNKANLQFKLGADGKTPVPYWIYFDLDGDFSFLEVVGSIGYLYDAPATATDACSYNPYEAISSGSTSDAGFAMCYAGKLTITVNIQVKSTERDNNKLPTQADYDALNTATDPNKFTYTAGTPEADGNIYNGTLVFTYEIRKAEVDNTKIKDTSLLQWKYTTEDDTKWRDYTATSFPEYNEIAQVDFRINPSKYSSAGDGYLAGVKDASLESITNAAGQPEKQGPGQRFVTIAYTVDENNYEKVNYTNATLSGKYEYQIEISPKVIDSSKLTLTTWKDSNGNDKTNSLGLPYQIWELDLENALFADFIDYEYYMFTGGTVGAHIGTGDQALLDLTNPSGAYGYLNLDAGSSVYIYVKPVINANVDKINGSPKYVLKDLSGTTDKDSAGVDGYKKFEFGKQMTVIKVELVKGDSVYGDAFTAAEIIKVTIGGSVAAESTYNTAVYKNKIDNANLIGDMAAFCANSASLDAGKYIIKVTAVNDAMFVAVPATVNFEITSKAIAVPTLDNFEYSGSLIDITTKLGGTYLDETLKKYMSVSGDTEGKDVKEGGYAIFIKLTNGNYKWADGSENAAVKFTLTGATAEVTSDDTAKLVWNITPYVLKDLKWDTSKTNAQLNIPEQVQAILSAAGVEVAYNYYDQNGELVTKLEGGKTYRAEAVLTGDGAALGNVVFEKTSEDGSTVPSLVSDRKVYETKKSFFASALDWAKKNWWILLAILVGIILLILLICLLVHRRKTKEAREEKKAQKEEDRRRREEEREAERRRREQELELQKAKQEAELAKMRAGLGLGAGAAGMAMAAQQAMPAPAQQPMQQQMPVQQYPQYQQPQMPQYQQPMMQPQMQMPMPMPQQYHSMNASDVNALAEAKAQQAIAEARAAAAQSKAAEAIAEAKAAQAVAGISPWMHTQPNGYNQAQPNSQQPMMPLIISVGADGQITGVQQLNTMQNMQQPMLQPIFISSPTPQPKAELPQKVEESAATSVSTPTVYPPDAVITTTTTVDTTKAKPEPVSRDSERNFDIDGFYDTFDINNK